MSPQLLALLQSIDREMRRRHGSPDEMGAIYPRDYLSPLDIFRRFGLDF